VINYDNQQQSSSCDNFTLRKSQLNIQIYRSPRS